MRLGFLHLKGILYDQSIVRSLGGVFCFFGAGTGVEEVHLEGIEVVGLQESLQVLDFGHSLEFCRVWINVLVRQSRLDSLFLLSGVKEESVIELFLNLRIEDSFQGGGGVSGAWLRQKQIRLESLWV